jgi:hypothetical protein
VVPRHVATQHRAPLAAAEEAADITVAAVEVAARTAVEVAAAVLTAAVAITNSLLL